MKIILIFFVCITQLNALGQANHDSIAHALMGKDGRSYMTVSGNDGKMHRWQHFTGRLLTTYEPVADLLQLHNGKNTEELIGVTKKEVVIWNSYTGNIKHRIVYPSTFQNSFSSLRFSSHKNRISDLDPLSNRLLVASDRNIVLIDLTKKETLHTLSFEYFIESPILVKNGNSMIAIETVKNEIFSIDFKNGERTLLQKDTYSSSIGTTADHKKFFIGNHYGIVVYDDSFQEAFKLKPSIGLRSHKPAQFLDNFDIIANPLGENISLFMNGYKEPVYVKTPFTVAGISAANGNLLCWNSKSVFVSDFTAHPLYYQPHYKSPLFSAAAGNVTFGETDSTLALVKNGETINLVHKSPVTVFDNDKQLLSADINGSIYKWSPEGKLTLTTEVLSGAVTHLKAISPDVVLVGSSGRMVEYNLKNKTTTKVLRGLHGAVISSYYDAARKLLITGTSENQLVLWDLLTASQIKSYTADAIPLTIQFNGKEIVYTNGKEQALKLNVEQAIISYYNPPRKIIINTTHRSKVESLSFSGDGKQLLSTDGEGIIKLWDVASLVPLRTMYMNNNASHSIFSHDAKEILNYNQDRIFHINASNGQLIQQFDMPHFYGDIKVHNLSMHPNNRTVFINNNNSPVQMQLNLNLQKFYFLHNSGHQYAPFGQDISPDGNQMATLGNNVEIWDLTTARKIKTIEHPNNHWKNKYVKRLIKYSPDAKMLLLEQDKGYRVYNLETGKDVIVLNSVYLPIFTGTNRLVYYDKNKDLVGLNLTTGKEYFRHTPRDEYIPDAIAYDTTNQLLAVGFYNGEIQVLNAENGRVIKFNRIHASRTAGAINPVSGEIALGAPDKIKIFDWLQAREKRTITVGRNGSVPKVAYSPDGQHMLVEIGGKTRIYNSTGDKLIHAFNQSGTSKFSGDSRLLAIADLDSLFVYDLQGNIPLKPLFILKTNHLGFDFVTGKKEIHLIRSEQKKDQDKLLSYEAKSDFFHVKYDLATGLKTEETQSFSGNYISSITYSPNGNFNFYETTYGSIEINDLHSGAKVKLEHNGSIDYTGVSADSRYVIIGDDEGGLYLYDIKTGKQKVSLSGHSGPIRSVTFWKDYMFSSSSDGSGIIWHNKTHQKLAQINPFNSGDYIFINSNNYYTGTTGISQAVFFNQKDKVFPFEQYDLVYNRPDLVVKSFDSSNKVLVNAYYEAYLKRLKKHGFDINQVSDAGQNAPELKLNLNNVPIETTSRTVSFGMEVREKSHFLESINIWVNDVPVYGAAGLSLKGKKLKQFAKNVSLDLCQGRNKIQVSCYNSKGVESLKETFELTYNPPQTKKPNLYLIALSVSDYKDDSYDLRYARKDGHDLATAFANKTDVYEQIFIDTLFDKEAVKERFLSLKKKLAESDVDDHVMVFVAGHGLLDKKFNFYYATYDCDFKDPSRRGLAYEDIESLLDSIPARQKVLLMDACHSGEVDKGSLEKTTDNNLEQRVVSTFKSNKRGGAVDNASSGLTLNNSFLLMQELFANLHRGSGAVVISASAGDSYALESDIWKNGIFTYTLLEGLKTMKADLDNDDMVSVNELKEYVYKNVEAATGGNQKPTARQQNLELNFKVW